MPDKAECAACGEPFKLDAVHYRVEVDDYETLLCCSPACVQAIHANTDPHCTCNDCVAALARQTA